ncbi:MAG TPA: RNA-binding cell elongation regulator Jag/EloR [Candidatus Nitrosotenuis sp.]|jgi:spoIIIJ-associated protein|nr:RNA-binding cell elongation regulator Jag/EloR [Candidatus Nitrosotenuis sp.]
MPDEYDKERKEAELPEHDSDEVEDEDWEEADDPVADLLYEIVKRMGFEADVEWEEREDHVRYFIEGPEDLGALIGRRGSTLEALQYLVGVINARKHLVEHRIIVDVQGYRERHEGRLRALARRTASRALRERQKIALEPMASQDRRIIHLALADHPSVSTYSEGEEPERCVVVAPSRRGRGSEGRNSPRSERAVRE